MAYDPSIEKEGTDPHPVMIRWNNDHLQIEDELLRGPSLSLFARSKNAAVPALFDGEWIGRRHSPVPGLCFTSNFSKLGLLAQLRRKPPRHCDWFSKIGSVIINDDGSCAISSILMCMESQGRMPTRKYDGADSIFLRVREGVVASLKFRCEETKVWTRTGGAPSMEGVLDLICSLETGVPTVFDSIFLILKSYKTFEARKLAPEEVADMIQKQGPVVGTLYTDDEDYFNSTVYRGDETKIVPNHVVVCSGYRFVDDELLIMIVDNHTRGGPVRFVLHQAFMNFHVLTVSTSKHVDIPKKFGCRMF